MLQWTTEVEKTVGRMVQIILTDPDLLSLHQRFGGELFRRSSVFHELKRFLEENEVRGGTCLEVGTWNAVTASILSRFFERVHTVDIVSNPRAREVLDYLGIENVELHVVSDNREKAELVRSLTFDFAYLDGDHAHDTDSDFDLVKHCGRVLFQECLPMQPPVWRLVRKLPAKEVTFGGIGLALWERSRK